jgi:hypothetical protein
MKRRQSYLQQGLTLRNHEGLTRAEHPSSTTFWLELQEMQQERNATFPPSMWTKVATSDHLDPGEYRG